MPGRTPRGACSRLLIPPTLSHILRYSSFQMQVLMTSLGHNPLWMQVSVEDAAVDPQGELKPQSLCKQDIRWCQKDQKRLEVFLRSLSLPPSPLSLYLALAVSRRLLYSKQEDMAAGETQLYAKVSNKLKGRSTPSLLDPLLAMGIPTHTA